MGFKLQKVMLIGINNRNIGVGFIFVSLYIIVSKSEFERMYILMYEMGYIIGFGYIGYDDLLNFYLFYIVSGRSVMIYDYVV